ncbi:MAG TPA: amidohydrolase [Candidatus Limnocylindria bacterium]|nr:amidohydrolase [Candidatus Limnocylindria bacterium]
MPLETLISGRIATFAGAAGFGWVEAIGIRDGKVAFAGTAIELETRADPHTRRIELEPGEIAIPGLTDAHLHVIDAALAAEQVNLAEAQTIDEALTLIEAGAARIPEPGWVQGGSWDHRRFGAWPTADAIEQVAPGRLVALRSFDHHGMWASHAALRAAGIDRTTPDPDGGVIRRASNGEAEGVLLENASELLSDIIPLPSNETVGRAVQELGRRLLELGVVGAHDPRFLAPDPTNTAFDMFTELAERGDLPIRVHVGVRAEGLDDAIARGFRSGKPIGRSDGEGHRLTMGWLKLFADGTLASRTAATLQPVEGTDIRGYFTTPPDELAASAAKAAAAGIATKIHAIGDAAVRTALDVLGPTASKVALMPRLEHVQLCDAADRARFAKLGVAASVQPVHLRDDADTARRDWGRRAEANGYTWRSLIDAGAVVAFGTDAPVEPIDPWPGIAMAVLRRDPSWGADAAPFGPDETLTLEQALRAATVGPYQTAKQPLGGRLVPGSRADLIVLPAAPRERGSSDVPASQGAAAFAEVRPRVVMLDGDVVLER